MDNSLNPFSLENKTILVTGASSGIGQAIAIACAKMGATVVATARNEARLQGTLQQMPKGNHALVSADLTKEDEIEALAANKINAITDLVTGKIYTINII